MMWIGRLRGCDVKKHLDWFSDNEALGKFWSGDAFLNHQVPPTKHSFAVHFQIVIDFSGNYTHAPLGNGRPC